MKEGGNYEDKENFKKQHEKQKLRDAAKFQIDLISSELKYKIEVANTKRDEEIVRLEEEIKHIDPKDPMYEYEVQRRQREMQRLRNDANKIGKKAMEAAEREMNRIETERDTALEDVDKPNTASVKELTKPKMDTAINKELMEAWEKDEELRKFLDNQDDDLGE